MPHNLTQKLVITIFGVLIFNITRVSAQLGGTYTIPGNFASIDAAITSLNAQGVNAPVVIEISAGFTEIAPVGGYFLNAIAGASASNSITFQKSGTGSNPLIMAYTGGTATPSSQLQDGVWRFVGTDYVTIDGIDLMDSNTSNPSTMEFGYGFYKASATDGCQYNTIKNCTITLNRINSASGTTGNLGPAFHGSKGISFTNTTYSLNMTNVTVSSNAGSNSYNRIYSNLIQNCQIGIAIAGYSNTVNGNLADTDNDIGGNSVSTGNNILNYGGGGPGASAAAIMTTAQFNINTSYNVINNNNGSGVSHPFALYGVNHYYNAKNSLASINNNTITIHGGGNAQETIAIQNVESSTGILTNSVTLSHNIIQNCTYTTSTSGGFVAIKATGSSRSLTVRKNLVSNTTSAHNSVLMYISGGNYTSVRSNTLSACTSSALAEAINCTNADNLEADSNLVEAIKANSINGIVSGSSVGSFTASTNTVKNLSIPWGGNIYGIADQGAASTKLLQNNQIYNFSVTATGTGGGKFYGMYCTSGSITATGNTIHSLTSSGANGSANVYVYGILINSGQQADINKNKIYNLSSASPKGYVSGISTNIIGSVSNNLIGGLFNQNAASGHNMTGIESTNGFNKIYHNTIYLNGVSTSSISGTSALYVASTADIRNNICVNLSTPSGAGITCAYRKASVSTSDSTKNNLFYAGTPSASRVIYNDFTNSYQTLTAYKTMAGLRDVFSVTENPPFITTTGSSNNFLGISPTPTTQVESGGTPVTSVPTDYANALRNTSTPDIGAWEGAYNGVDISSPCLLSYGFTNPSTCSTSSRTFTVAIGDLSGVASGTFSPKVYYKINSGSYVYASGLLSSGTSTNGVWSFNLNYSAAPTNTISYYIVAQDILSNPVMSYPANGFSAVDVNTIISPPSTPFTYTISYTLNGTYFVGSGGHFTTLTQAATAYNTACITGSVEYVLTDNLYSFAETFPITFTNNMDASPTNSLLIRPLASTSVTINGSTSSTAVLKFLAARYIKIDGINSSSSSLTLINNTSTWSNAAAAIWLAASITGCTNIDVFNTTIYGANSSIITSRGISSGYDGLQVSLTTGNNHNISIQGNTFLRVYDAIYAGGNNWVIKNNIIGPSATGANDVKGSGIYASPANNLTINGNLIRNVSGVNSAACGIILYQDIVLATVSQNTIQSVSFNTGSSSTYGFSAGGIYAGYNCRKLNVNSNMITGITSTYNNGGVRGISFNNNISFTDTNYIFNNMISGLTAKSGNLTGTWPAGIEIANCYNLYTDNNSINLSGTYTGTTGVSGSAAMIVRGSGNDNLRIRNNIFSNSLYNSSASTSTVYALYSITNPATMAVDYNNYYVGGGATTKYLAYQNLGLNSLATIQSIMGGNMNSATLTPVFNSSTDLHILMSTVNLPFENHGSPLPHIITDLDTDPRNAATPDIGADEFTIPLCASANSGTISSSTLQACPGQTISLSSSGADPGVNATYQWLVSNTPGGPYTPLSSGSGASATSYTTPALPAGVYYYTLNGTCGTSTVTSTSNEATVTIHPTPTITVSGGNICRGQTFTFTPSGAATYTYSNGSSTVSPLATSNYTITGKSAEGCNAPAVVVNVVVNPIPTVSVSNGSICYGQSYTISPSGASTYTYSSGSAVVSPTVITSYTVTGTSAAGCTNTNIAVATVSVNSIPTITASSGTICAGKTFTIIPGGANSYTFSGGSAVVSPAITTSYSVSGTSSAGCTSTTQAISTITVIALPNVTITTSSPSICTGQNATLTASGATSYSWSTGALTPSITVAPTTNSSYSVTAYDQGCQAMASFTQQVKPLPVITINPSPATACAGEQKILTASGAATYTWQPQGTISASVNVVASTTTVFTVTGTGMNNCVNTKTVQFNVNPCTGVEENNTHAGSLNIYPNPTTGLFIIDLDHEYQNCTVTVYNALGQVVYDTTLTTQQTIIDLGNVSGGIYTLQISSDTKIIRREKIVKE